LNKRKSQVLEELNRACMAVLMSEQGTAAKDLGLEVLGSSLWAGRQTYQS